MRDIIDISKASDTQQYIKDITDDELFELKTKALHKRNGYITYRSSQQVDDDGATLRVSIYDLKVSYAPPASGENAFLKDAERPDTRFDDVIGAENAKEELRYFIRYLNKPREFMLSGGKPPKGILLYGPPGTGKTMLARAMAGESNVAFIQTSATQFMDKFVGESERHIRDIFRKARQNSPAIIFIDEIDAIGKERTGNDTSQVTEQMLNALLTEMDGFTVDPDNPVFVLAATNYGADGSIAIQRNLDPALLRRFDNQIQVDLPNKEERARYIRLILSKRNVTGVSEHVITNIADRTTGKSLAIIQNIIELAFRNARRKNVALDDSLLLEALAEYQHGEKHEWSQDYYETVAVHESGHTVVAYLSGEKPSYVTIVSRSSFGGYMSHENIEDKPNFSKDEMLWRIRTALAGRAAEKVFFGSEKAVNTGASSDLQNATSIALHMLASYGMTEGRLISLPIETIMQTPLAKDYLDQANAILEREMRFTEQLIADNRELVERLSKALLASNDLTASQIEAVLSGGEPATTQQS